MPVRTMDSAVGTGRFDWIDGDWTFSSLDSLVPSTEPLLPDDIWKKFELDFPEFATLDDVLEESTLPKLTCSSLYPLIGDIWEIRNHDCMWAGHCGSKEHPADEPRGTHAGCFVPPTPVASLLQTPVASMQHETVGKQACGAPQQPQAQPQQSLLKPAVRAAAATAAGALVNAPQTPPMSDDEEVKPKHAPTQVLQILTQTISECDLDEDSDLCDYFDEDAVDVEDDADADDEKKAEEDEKFKIRLKFAAESDHSYHKGKQASMCMDNLGIDTPSDSEEEIDVVSVVDKLQQTCSLPNNPSHKDRRQIQKRVATAISKKRINHNGIKTILPSRKPPTSSSEGSPVKKRAGVKRPRQYKTAYSVYKKRHYSSDSEPEPSEKRSLHNNMERQRRIDLRNAFEDLRQLVPDVSKKERAAKVVILREASVYCEELTGQSDSYLRYIEELKRKQEWLRSRVSQLRRNLAIQR